MATATKTGVTSYTTTSEREVVVTRVVDAPRRLRTTITLTIAYPSKAARDAALETGMKGGMDESFARLDRLVQRLA